MASLRFPKPEVVLSQQWIAIENGMQIDYTIVNEAWTRK